MASQLSPNLFTRPGLPQKAYFGNEMIKVNDEFDSDYCRQQVLRVPATLQATMLGELLEKLINKHGEQRVLAVLEKNEQLFE